ncbi:2OG-Fe(II) oxygenase family protein [Streptomyces olivaceoviridis]|uniref:2OG-Fe(II) oxygenase family protein n=1 Tax=Streptomyces olivaceoviridis TaxID=1921 RepID=UPI0036A02250
MLYQDGAGGLEVEQKRRGWREVPFTQGGFVVNIGDLLAFWTAGRWVSTLHRVRNPAEGRTGARISIPFFHMPRHDAPVEPLFPFSDAATETRFRTATAPGEWYRERLAAMVGRTTYRAIPARADRVSLVSAQSVLPARSGTVTRSASCRRPEGFTMSSSRSSRDGRKRP